LAADTNTVAHTAASSANFATKAADTNGKIELPQTSANMVTTTRLLSLRSKTRLPTTAAPTSAATSIGRWLI
jgi:hypothetical protein